MDRVQKTPRHAVTFLIPKGALALFNLKNLHNDESGITALETAIILIAFIVVASVFAFTILSAGSASTERGQEAIYAGLEGVQSSMEVKGAVIAKGDTTAKTVTDLVFTLAPVSGGDPVDLTPGGTVVIGYRDEAQYLNDMTYTVTWVGASDGDNLLEENELAEITVPVSGGVLTAGDLAANTAFTLEVKPPTGAVLSIGRTTPAAIEAVMELR
jgi:flagellin FlaB